MSTITITKDTLDSILTRLAALETQNDQLLRTLASQATCIDEADVKIEYLEDLVDERAQERIAGLEEAEHIADDRIGALDEQVETLQHLVTDLTKNH